MPCLYETIFPGLAINHMIHEINNTTNPIIGRIRLTLNPPQISEAETSSSITIFGTKLPKSRSFKFDKL
jgi:hypothetical protein